MTKFRKKPPYKLEYVRKVGDFCEWKIHHTAGNHITGRRPGRAEKVREFVEKQVKRLNDTAFVPDFNIGAGKF